MRIMTRRSLVLLSVILGLSVPGLSSGARDTVQAAPGREVRVVYKLIQVSVVDRSGDPVADLGQGDFELSDNGKTVAIEHFESHTGGTPEAGGPEQPGPGFGRRYFLIFDFGLVRPKAIEEARQAALRFLDDVARPEDEVAMVSFSMATGLRVHEYLTNDHARIRRAVAALASGPLQGGADRLARYWIESMEKRPAAIPANRQGEGSEYASKYMDVPAMEMDKSLDILNVSLQFSREIQTMAKSLRYVPGIKNVILFSEGIPRPLLYGKKATVSDGMSEWATEGQLAQALAANRQTEVPRQNVLEAHQAMMKELKASDCPVYCVDTAPPKGGPDVEIDEMGTQFGNETLGRATLNEISTNTGGDYLGRASQPDMTARAIRRLTGSVYILGYPVKDNWDGKYHKVKVKVLRKGCKVVAQAGYNNPKPYSQYSTDDKLFQLMDLALSDNPQFLSAGGSLPFVAFPVWDQGWSYLAGIVRIPGEKADEALGKDAETFLLLLNERNDIQSITSFDFGERRPGTGTLDARFVLPMKPGRYAVRFVARNRLSGWGARGNAALTIPDAQAATAWFDPPLLLAASKGIVQADAPLAMTLTALYPYDAGAFAPALGAVPRGTDKLHAVVRCPANMSESELELSASLSEGGDRAGAGIPVSVLNTMRQGATRVLFIEIPCGGLAPGAYTLKLSMKEKDGFLSGATGASFRIE